MKLTTREREVLEQLAAGWTDEQIGMRMGIKTTSVRTTIARALLRTQSHSRVDAVLTAIRQGLIPLMVGSTKVWFEREGER